MLRVLGAAIGKVELPRVGTVHLVQDGVTTGVTMSIEVDTADIDAADQLGDHTGCGLLV